MSVYLSPHERLTYLPYAILINFSRYSPEAAGSHCRLVWDEPDSHRPAQFWAISSTAWDIEISKMPAVMRARHRRFSAWTAEAKCLMGNKLEIDRAERSSGVFTRAIDENLQLVGSKKRNSFYFSSFKGLISIFKRALFHMAWYRRTGFLVFCCCYHNCCWCILSSLDFSLFLCFLLFIISVHLEYILFVYFD